MTIKLYQTETYLRECEATIIERSTIEGKPAVLLDRTIFYPTSGGQMHDTGYINQIRVIDVRLLEDKIWHILSEPLLEDHVYAVLDWERRFDFMQQHTAFHILAGSFLKLYQFATISSHLGETVSTIDVEAADITPEQLEGVEELANEIVWENRPVRIFEVSEEKAKTMNVRKQAMVSGVVRLVEIEGHDLDPCGGTHVCCTGQVGMIKIIGCERVRKNLRFTFVAGRRAWSLLKSYHHIQQQLCGMLGTSTDSLIVSCERLLGEQKELQKKIREQAKFIAEFRLQELLQRAKTEKIVDHIFTDMDMESLRRLASAAVKQQPAIYLLASSSERAYVVFAASSDKVDLRPFFNQVMDKIAGKGGGEAVFMQGSGSNVSALPAAIASIKAAMVEKLK